MAIKYINVLKWCVDKGICEDVNDTRQAQNAIRWVKRNLKSCNMVCVKRGVYEAEESALERAYTAHKSNCVKTSEKRRELMQKKNAARAQKDADGEDHAKGQPEETSEETSEETPPRPSSPAAGRKRATRASRRTVLGEGGDYS